MGKNASSPFGWRIHRFATGCQWQLVRTEVVVHSLQGVVSGPSQKSTTEVAATRMLDSAVKRRQFEFGRGD